MIYLSKSSHGGYRAGCELRDSISGNELEIVTAKRYSGLSTCINRIRHVSTGMVEITGQLEFIKEQGNATAAKVEKLCKAAAEKYILENPSYHIV